MSDVLDRLQVALAHRYAIERELGSGGMATAQPWPWRNLADGDQPGNWRRLLPSMVRR
ncbi:MAG: hypothetical protein IH966_00845 [Gemmatimonadetes bacterium]|nr:hypothetical protein [Gemmatimonadota bacterium]